MKLRYDDSADAAYIYIEGDIKPGGVAKTYVCDPDEVNAHIHLDFDAEGRLLGIEVLDASRYLPRAVIEGRLSNASRLELLWQELERSLTRLVESMSTALGDKDRGLVKQFIEHSEYGLALETLYGSIVEGPTVLSAAQQTEIQRLADLMEIDLRQLGAD